MPPRRQQTLPQRVCGQLQTNSANGAVGRRRRAALAACQHDGGPPVVHVRPVGDVLMHNVTGSGEEVATCSVCLGTFQTGETVQLFAAMVDAAAGGSDVRRGGGGVGEREQGRRGSHG